MHGHLNLRLCNVLRLSHWAAKRVYKWSKSTKKDMHQVLTYPTTSKEFVCQIIPGKKHINFWLCYRVFDVDFRSNVATREKQSVVLDGKNI